jgi:hypothetical protein
MAGERLDRPRPNPRIARSEQKACRSTCTEVCGSCVAHALSVNQGQPRANPPQLEVRIPVIPITDSGVPDQRFR